MLSRILFLLPLALLLITGPPYLSAKKSVSLTLELQLTKARIKLVKDRITVGEFLPLVAHIRNQGTESVELFQAGSLRPTPRIEFRVVDIATNVLVTPIPLGGCGNTDPISETDFLTIAPQEREAVDIESVSPLFPLVPGKRYRVTVHYKNDPTDPRIVAGESGLWSHTPGLVEKIKTTQGCDLSSNPVEITVE